MRFFTAIVSLLCFVLEVSSQNVALNFDGSDDLVQTTYPGISGRNVRTVEARIRTSANCDPQKGGRQQIITDWGAASTGARFTLNIKTNNTLRLEVSGSGIDGKTAINDGKWHHVAVVLSNSTSAPLSLYVDGALERSGNISTTINTGSSVNMRIGQRVDGTNNFTGDIDEVRVFNIARTQKEIQADMNKEYCSQPKGLVAYYKLNDGDAGKTNTSNKTARDNTSGSKNGTLSGFALSGSSSNWVVGDTIKGGDTKAEFDTFACYTYTGPSGKTYTSPGTYTETMKNKAGCDSVITVKLRLGRVFDYKQVTVCDSFVSRLGNIYHSSGLYRDTVVGVTQDGCDSIYLRDVLVRQAKATNESVTACDSLKIESTWFYGDTTLRFTNQANTGCDSVHTIELDIFPTTFSILKEATCDRYTSALKNTYTETGVYQEKLSKANQYGCDSVINLDLTIFQSYDTIEQIMSCDSFVSPTGVVYSSSGEYPESFTSKHGCDSVITYNVEIHPSYKINLTDEGCDSVRVGNQWYFTSQLVTQNLTSSTGCDSTVQTDITVVTVDAGISLDSSTITANEDNAKYVWYDCDKNTALTGGNKQSFVAPYSGLFKVVVTKDNCTVESECVQVRGLSIVSFIHGEILLYPNPSNNSIAIESPRYNIKQVQILSVVGEVVVHKKVENVRNTSIDFELDPGTYIVVILDENDQRYSQRLIVE